MIKLWGCYVHIHFSDRPIKAKVHVIVIFEWNSLKMLFHIRLQLQNIEA